MPPQRVHPFQRPRTQSLVNRPKILDHVNRGRDEMVRLLKSMVLAESPTDVPESQREPQRLVGDALKELDFDVRTIPGQATGGHLYARPAGRPRGRTAQLLIGHSDTVWPIGTLDEMPLRVEGGRLYGPGAFDMKGGIVQILFALRAIRELGLEPEVTPLVFMNSDEETGSQESRPWVRRLARSSCRALVLEPSLGQRGMLKTARKGVGRFDITAVGKASHAGLDPESGASAIAELAHVIHKAHRLSDPARGITVNVGVIEGGSRPNVIAARAKAFVDVRVLSGADGERVAAAIRSFESETPGVRLEIEGGMEVPPLERTPRNRALWETARELGGRLGLELEESTAGGGSDGNTTSQYTATLDGLGPVGDGAHALHEHIEIDGWVERCALLTELILAPPARA